MLLCISSSQSCGSCQAASLAPHAWHEHAGYTATRATSPPEMLDEPMALLLLSLLLTERKDSACPKVACWLNLQEGWWRLFRRDALAGQNFANPSEIDQARKMPTVQLNARAKPWVWGRAPTSPRYHRHVFY